MGSSWTGDRTHVPTWAGGLPPTKPPGKAPRKVTGRAGILRKQRARVWPAGVGKKELRPPKLATHGECSRLRQVLLETKAAVTGEQSSPRSRSRCVTPREPSELPEAEEQGTSHVHTGPPQPLPQGPGGHSASIGRPGVQRALTWQGGRVCRGAPDSPRPAGQRWTCSCVSGGSEEEP